MVHRYDDEVEVRVLLTAPETFLWRGRVYRVRQVLGHWFERRAWWTEPAVRAVHGEEGAGAPGPSSAAAAEMSSGEMSSLVGDQEVWRVEAGAGRSAATGVYDLGRAPGPGRPWRLLRVDD